MMSIMWGKCPMNIHVSQRKTCRKDYGTQKTVLFRWDCHEFYPQYSILLFLSLFSLQGYCLKYTRRLEAGGKFKLTIWPDHCLIGSDGHAIQKDIQEAVREWDIFHYTKMVKHIHKVKFWSVFLECNCQANLSTLSNSSTLPSCLP